MRWLTKTLTLSSPHQKIPAAEIREVQHMLGLREDGEYGVLTANAVRAWKYRVGFHEKFVTHNLTPSESEWLFGTLKPTSAMRLRARSRNQKPKSVEALGVMREWASLGSYETSNNFVPRLSRAARDLGLAPAYQNMGWSWCAFAVFLSGLKVGSSVAKDLFSGSFNSKLVLYVPQILAYARKGEHGLHVVDWNTAKPGDLVAYDWDGGVPDHMGRLVEKKDSNTILAVEGNTSAGSSGSQSNGDGVYTRIRYKHNIVAFIREAG